MSSAVGGTKTAVSTPGAPSPSMDSYQYIEQIGSGTYGTVFRASVKDSPQEIVAIKRFKDSDQSDDQVLKTAMREVSLLRTLRHDNVVSLLDVFRHHNKLCLVFEYVEGTVLQLLERQSGTPGLAEPLAKRLLWQVLRAVDYLHTNGVVHRDIKPENLLISSQGLLKLCDFGFARRLRDGGGGGTSGRYTTYVATRWYRAPELLLGSGEYGPEVDIWAVGCLLVELLTGRPLFPGESDVDQLRLILACFGPLAEGQLGQLPRHKLHAAVPLPAPGGQCTLRDRCHHLSPNALDFLEGCLRPDPAQRLTAGALLAHSYFADTAAWLSPEFLEAQKQARRELEARMSLLSKRRRLQLNTAEALQLPEGKHSTRITTGAHHISVDARSGTPAGSARTRTETGEGGACGGEATAAAAARAAGCGGGVGSSSSSRHSSNVAAPRPVTHHCPQGQRYGGPSAAASSAGPLPAGPRRPPQTAHGGGAASPLRGSKAGNTHARPAQASPYLSRPFPSPTESKTRGPSSPAKRSVQSRDSATYPAPALRPSPEKERRLQEEVQQQHSPARRPQSRLAGGAAVRPAAPATAAERSEACSTAPAAGGPALVPAPPSGDAGAPQLPCSKPAVAAVVEQALAAAAVSAPAQIGEGAAHHNEPLQDVSPAPGATLKKRAPGLLQRLLRSSKPSSKAADKATAAGKTAGPLPIKR